MNNSYLELIACHAHLLKRSALALASIQGVSPDHLMLFIAGGNYIKAAINR